MENTSGIYPSGDRVLIRPEEIEKVTEGGIIIPETISERHAMAQSIGVLVAVGPDVWIDHFNFDQQGQIVGYQGRQGAYAKVGDRVIYAKYGGLQMTGSDGEMYRLMNDEDITGTCDAGVNFTDLKARKPMHRSKE